MKMPINSNKRCCYSQYDIREWSISVDSFSVVTKCGQSVIMFDRFACIYIVFAYLCFTYCLIAI